MNTEAALLTVSLLWAILTPFAVWFGIRVGTLRERDAQARRRAEQAALSDRRTQASRRSTRLPSNTRSLLDWRNGRGRYDSSIDE